MSTDEPIDSRDSRATRALEPSDDRIDGGGGISCEAFSCEALSERRASSVEEAAEAATVEGVAAEARPSCARAGRVAARLEGALQMYTHRGRGWRTDGRECRRQARGRGWSRRRWRDRGASPRMDEASRLDLGGDRFRLRGAGVG